MRKFQREKILKLRKEIQVKDFIVQELLKIITKEKIKVPETLLKNIYILYRGVPDGKRKETKEETVEKEKGKVVRISGE